MLDAVRRSRILADPERCSRIFSAMFDSFGEQLSEYIDRFFVARKEQFVAFCDRRFGVSVLSGDQKMQQNGDAMKRLLHRYVLRHDGKFLSELFFKKYIISIKHFGYIISAKFLGNFSI